MSTEVNISLESSGFIVSEVVLTQSRVAVTEGGAPGYKVMNYLNDKGQLPDYGVFLVQVVDPADAGQDTLVRVCEVPDFFAYTTQRATAISSGGMMYRSAGWSSTYTDLSVAQTAAAEFKGRVNSLLKTWLMYVYNFSAAAPGEWYHMPTIDDGAFAALVSDWTKAKDATASAKLNLESATTSYVAAGVALTAAQDKEVVIKKLADTNVALSGQSDVLRSVIASLKAGDTNMGYPSSGFTKAVNDLIGVIDGTSNVPAEVTTARNDFVNTTGMPLLGVIDNQLFGPDCLGLAVAAYTDLSTDVAASAEAVRQARVDTEAAEALVRTTQQAKNSAQTDYDSAVAVENKALTAVQNACPKFDANNPLSLFSRG